MRTIWQKLNIPEPWKHVRGCNFNCGYCVKISQVTVKNSAWRIIQFTLCWKLSCVHVCVWYMCEKDVQKVRVRFGPGGEETETLAAEFKHKRVHLSAVKRPDGHSSERFLSAMLMAAVTDGAALCEAPWGPTSGLETEREVSPTRWDFSCSSSGPRLEALRHPCVFSLELSNDVWSWKRNKSRRYNILTIRLNVKFLLPKFYEWISQNHTEFLFTSSRWDFNLVHVGKKSLMREEWWEPLFCFQFNNISVLWVTNDIMLCWKLVKTRSEALIQEKMVSGDENRLGVTEQRSPRSLPIMAPYRRNMQVHFTKLIVDGWSLCRILNCKHPCQAQTEEA